MYLALLFKHQLTAFVEKIYGMIWEILNKDIYSLLGLCIRGGIPVSFNVFFTASFSCLAKRVVDERIIFSLLWTGIKKITGNFSKRFRSSLFTYRVFTQIFSFMNCCSFSNCEYVKSGLAELEHWCYKAADEYAGSAWDELKHIRQAIDFLVIHQKLQKTRYTINHNLCPGVSVQQLDPIITIYWDDKYGTQNDSNNAVINSLAGRRNPRFTLFFFVAH
ncbi:unnamed protein product [Spirodela intermedia]|uniref:Dilute domain-containing protein n=1 Tax=Spirodela intermedia TaxID=51605 RepID=A0A7I8KQX2_SPIIN|nr:unnamed protein product [Spirodela intermedia]